jgi:IS30 family transposase
MRDWKQVHVYAGIEVFFCDPHVPWQRGSNDNTNGLLRQYFLKGFDFTTITESELDAVADELNARPRKRFGFATPTEQLSERGSDHGRP